MKKFASVILCLIMVLSMAVTGIASVSAAEDTQGTITIRKYKTGTYDSETEKGTPVPGAEFTIYQVLALGEDGLYTVNSQFSTVNDLLTDLATANSGTNGYLTYGKTEDLEAKISELQNKATTPYATPVLTNTQGVATFENVGYGVYLVVETGVPAGYTASTKSFLVAVNAENPNPVAIPKNAEINTDKNIVVGENQTAKKGTYAIGDTINYKITSQVPTYDKDILLELKKAEEQYNADKDSADMEKVEEPEQLYSRIPYYFIDTMSSGLTLDNTSINVKVNGDDFSGKFTVIEKYYDTEGNLITNTDVEHKTLLYIVINWTELCDFNTATGEATTNYMGKDVEVTYSATLNKFAEVTTGSGNHAELKYASDPATFDSTVYWETNGEPVPDPNPTPDPNDPVVYTYEMDLIKTFNGGLSTPDDVANVKFTLKLEETELKFKKDSGSDFYYPSTDSDASSELIVGSNGMIKVKGLKTGTYELTETATANGYTKLTSSVTIIVNDTENAAGVVSAVTYEVGKTEGKELGKANTGIFEITVNNAKSQFNLPSTGGMGLWIFTIAGAVVFGAAIIIFVSVRRKKSSK